MCIGILKGATPFYCDLIRCIDLKLTMDFMATSSYGSATKSSGVVRLLKDLDHDVLGRDVIIIEDIVEGKLRVGKHRKLPILRRHDWLLLAQIADIRHTVAVVLAIEYPHDAVHRVGLVLLYLKAKFHAFCSLLFFFAVLSRLFTVST